MGRNGRFNEESIPDQTGKQVIITGSNSGIGFEAAKVLAAKHAEITMACRNTAKGESAAETIRAAHPGAAITVMELDLADLDSVRQFAEQFKESHEELHLLINNAGVMAPPKRRETSDGFEIQIGTNHLGHFALTGHLLETLAKTRGSRVVVVSSLAHKGGKVDFDDLNSKRSYTPFKAYGQSKLANLLFTYELQRRLGEAGVETIAVAAHPGWTATNLQDNSKLFKSLNPLFAQKPAMGALPTLYAATVDDVRGGEFFGPSGLGEMRGFPKKVRSNARSHDAEVAGRLWDVSTELTKVEFQTLQG